MDRSPGHIELKGTAAKAIQKATDGIEAALPELVGAGEVRRLRAGLAATGRLPVAEPAQADPERATGNDKVVVRMAGA
jgi:hypothetical protein